MQLRFVPESADGDLVGEYKREFANWILGNALREMIESLEVCLGNVYQVCSLVAQTTGKQAPSRKITRPFEKSGVFGIASRHASYIETLTWLRNCLTHRRGIVADRDCNDRDSNCLKVNYLRFQF